MEGFDQGPRYVLEQQPEGLRGRLLDLIEIDSQHGAALEAALGPYVQALVVDTREHAAAIVRDLAEQRLGRVLLLVAPGFHFVSRKPETWHTTQVFHCRWSLRGCKTARSSPCAQKKRTREIASILQLASWSSWQVSSSDFKLSRS